MRKQRYASSAVRARQDRGKLKVLAVDDNSHNLITLDTVLKPLSVELMQAHSGAEALRLLLDHDFALILFNMRDGDGLETAAVIREREATRHVPIVFIIASDQSHLEMKCCSLGAVDYLIEPIIPEVLQAKVSSFVELFKKTREIKRQMGLLRQMRKRHEKNFSEARERWDEESRLEVEQARGKLLAIFEVTPDLIATVSPQGVPQYINSAGRRMLGIGDRDDITHVRLADLQLHSSTDEMWRGETYFNRTDGKWIPVSQLILPHKNSGGEVEFFSIIARDMREQELKERLQHVQKLDGIGKVAGGIAHDFNNLLTVILGRCQLLQSRLDQDDPLREELEVVVQTGERAAVLTRQLLAFSRKQVQRLKILDLNGVVTGIENMLRSSIGADIDLVVACSTNLGQVKADPGQIERVILNLVLNARDAMSNGGKLTIETANVTLDHGYARTHVEVLPGPYVMLAVSDTGCGMPPEVQSRLFEPFFTTKKNRGTGLGLATAYGIVKQSSGNIWVYSEVGRGTTFKVYLPRIDAAAANLSAPIAPGEPLRGSETVLLVDDDEILREHTARILEEAGGYTVLLAKDAEEARLMCARHDGPIHLMVSDVVMPSMKGPDLARVLLASHPEMKTLFVSGYTNASVGDLGVFESGAAFVQKPFAASVLLSTIRKVLDNALGIKTSHH